MRFHTILRKRTVFFFFCFFLYLLQDEYFGNYMTMLVFSVVSLIAAAVTMTLPESKNIKLPDTIDEAEHIGVGVRPAPDNNGTLA